MLWGSGSPCPNAARNSFPGRMPIVALGDLPDAGVGSAFHTPLSRFCQQLACRSRVNHRLHKRGNAPKVLGGRIDG